MSFTSWLFKAARLSADARAISKGPKTTVQRVARKAIYRPLGGKFASLLRKAGL